jgi:hypothetical protein
MRIHVSNSSRSPRRPPIVLVVTAGPRQLVLADSSDEHDRLLEVREIRAAAGSDHAS